ncbi:MAG: valine--tRNA ligase [Ruminococcaceae bacterium]|nr:valine--tRNA ligase [Oscillospiraceae bacterium]
MKKELAKTYSPAEIEDRLYAWWEEQGYFTPEMDKDKKPFSIVIPPPNVTGQLHMGHALNNTFQDIIIRTKRMQGYSTLWVPGTDHAGIATQIKVEANLREQKGLMRQDIGREEFLKLVWEWKQEYGGRIINQLKKLGSSCDWSRERFTMDESLSRAVRKTFVNLYNKGLIYRGLRIINWCPHCLTALSDAEVEHKEIGGAFWHIRYPVKDSDESVIIATTRPETMLGDSAVAVHPEDERYQHLIGKTLILPLVGREIPVVADDYVDREFGTGCVKITPCHDPNDFEIGQRHNLEMISVFGEDAKINEKGGRYEGLDRFEARKVIVEDLKKEGDLVKIEEHSHAVGHCYRCGTIVEPTASKQWFVKMEPLAKPAIEVVKDGEIQYIPDRFSKIYLNWMENIHDWCISRQLWWGHRIPAFYCSDCGELIVSETDVHTCPKCGSKNMKQDEDVLDTWFSSALWPFSTLGWPDKTEELDYYYPTNVLVTAYDIITFWVSKMIFMALENVEQIPFPRVFIHGLVRDAQGRKMSKSLGNGIDPLEVIKVYGADALRFALATGNSPGNDMRFSDEKIEAARNFNNKIWNAARFILMNLDIDSCQLPASDKLTLADKWILTKYNRLVKEVVANIDNYEIGIALGKLYDFIWDVFCDWYIELTKNRLSDKGSEDNAVAQNTICWVFSNTLKLLHPYMPFITEEIWQSMPHEGESIMISEYPTYDPALDFASDEAEMERILTAIKAIRNRRAEMNVPPSRKAKLVIASAYGDTFNESASPYFLRLASASSVEYDPAYADEKAVQIITDSANLFIPLADMIDLDKEKERLNKEKANTEGEIKRLEGKLSNAGFTAKAPAAVVEGEKNKLAGYKEKLAGILKAIEQLG